MNGIAKSASALLCALVLFSAAQAAEPKEKSKASVAPHSELPLGSWRYGVFAGKLRMGTANVSLTFDDGVYVSTSNMTMQRDNGALVCVMSETEKENASFSPISYFSSTTIITESKESRALVRASFKDGVVEIDDGEEKRSFRINGAFQITPNRLSVLMMRDGLKTGAVFKGMVYDPTIDEEKALEMTEKVIGPELVDLPTGKASLTHTVQSYGPLKNIHTWIDARGFTVRTSISILNQTIDLVLESYDAPKAKK
jgi:hypothetical protein